MSDYVWHDEVAARGKFAITKLFAFATALGTWAYLALTYGFWLGFVLGWLPAALLGSAVAALFVFFWAAMWSLIAMAGLFVLFVILTGA